MGKKKQENKRDNKSKPVFHKHNGKVRKPRSSGVKKHFSKGNLAPTDRLKEKGKEIVQLSRKNALADNSIALKEKLFAKVNDRKREGKDVSVGKDSHGQNRLKNNLDQSHKSSQKNHHQEQHLEKGFNHKNSKSNTFPVKTPKKHSLPKDKVDREPKSQAKQADLSNPAKTQPPTPTAKAGQSDQSERKLSADSNPTAKTKKKGKKKNHNGMSNWMMLCSTMNKDPSVRRAKPVHEPDAGADKSADGTNLPQEKGSKLDIWFDNVDDVYLEPANTSGMGKTAGDQTTETSRATHTKTTSGLVKEGSFQGLTNCVAMDCEMVGIGSHGEDSMLARVSIVNHYGVCLYDKFVLPQEKVVDFRTHVSGITERNLATGENFEKVQKEVNDVVKGRILVGHALHNDLKVLFLTHPKKQIRDTSKYKPFRQLFNGQSPSLKKLADTLLGVKVQEGEHSSVQDAQATMRLYTMYRQQWEKELRQTDKRKRKMSAS